MLYRIPRSPVQTDLRYLILGWKDFQVKTSSQKRYLAVGLRILNDGKTRRLLDLRHIRLLTNEGRACVFVAALPDRPANLYADQCMVEAGESTIVTLAFMIPDVTTRPFLRLARKTRASADPRPAQARAGSAR